MKTIKIKNIKIGDSKNWKMLSKTANPPPIKAPTNGINEINPAKIPMIYPPSRPIKNSERP